MCSLYATIPGYWLLVHPRASHWRARQQSPFRVLLPAWAAMLAVVLLVTSNYRETTLYTTAYAWVPAAALFSVGIYLYKTSLAGFTLKQLQGRAEIANDPKEQRLVTTGIRARLRHPVYLAHLCEMLAWTAGTGLAICIVLTVLAMILGGIMIRAEDKELEQRFGDAYRRYRDSVPAVVPKLGRAQDTSIIRFG